MRIHIHSKLGPLAAAIALAGAAGWALPAFAADLKAELSGGAKGDPMGGGAASFKVDPAKGEVCYTLSVTGIAPATMAHIHKAPEGQSGPVAVPLETPKDGKSEACATVTKEVAEALTATPAEYYVNVHNPAFPGGAVRGQLGK